MKIAIAGYGLEGKVSYRYWQERGDDDLTIIDEREQLDDVPDGAKTQLGQGAFDDLSGYDMVVRTAGLPPYKLQSAKKIWSATNEFFARCPAPIIGVTGTKGKGTTSSLIASILRAAGRTVHLVGNIGTPALEVLPGIESDDIVVFELSSFQLWDLEYSPQIAAVLMIEADHLNVHADLADYVAAKANIARHQTADDLLVYNQNNAISRQIADQSVAKKAVYPFAIDEYLESLHLPGAHNRENASAAIAAVRELGISDEEIHRGLAGFTGLPHRLELVRHLDGVAYYNDSFSSAPSATIAAIRAFESPEIVVIGGIDKGADFSELAEVISQSHQIKVIMLIGEIRHKLASRLEETGKRTIVSDAGTMPAIVDEARSHAEPGDIVILSPACASFDMFKNFNDRGDQFREVVLGL